MIKTRDCISLALVAALTASCANQQHPASKPGATDEVVTVVFTVDSKEVTVLRISGGDQRARDECVSSIRTGVARGISLGEEVSEGRKFECYSYGH